MVAARARLGILDVLFVAIDVESVGASRADLSLDQRRYYFNTNISHESTFVGFTLSIFLRQSWH